MQGAEPDKCIFSIARHVHGCQHLPAVSAGFGGDSETRAARHSKAHVSAADTHGAFRSAAAAARRVRLPRHRSEARRGGAGGVGGMMSIAGVPRRASRLQRIEADVEQRANHANL